MSINHDDPKLTAYALGELPEAEAAEVEAAVEKNPALKAEVEAIRRVAEQLKTTLAAEPLPGGEGADDGENANQATLAPKPETRRRLPRWILAGGTVAGIAFVLIGLISSSAYYARCSSKSSTEEMARLQSALRARETAGGESSVDCAEPEALAKAAPSNLRLRYNNHAARLAESPPALEDAVSKENKSEEFALSDAPAPSTPASPARSAPGYQANRPPKGQPAAGQPITAAAGKRDQRALGRRLSSQALFESKPAAPAEPSGETMGEHFTLDPSIRRPDGRFNTETYDKIVENEFKRVSEHPLSTFSIDVDTAGYSMVRKMLTQQGRMPPPGAVRLEELINYFDYSYEPPTDEVPFATHVDVATCPWNDKHGLVRIGLKGKVIEKEDRDPANLVFLLDVSGSMNQPNKLPLLKTAMSKLVENLNEKDRVAIAVYAGAAGLVLDSTPCSDKHKILEALDRLKAGGSTNGGAGIQLAYATAAANFIEGGVNRVILCTDGDFNIGMTNNSELISMIEKKAKDNIFLTVLGFGMGNYKDSRLEKLADKGNGNYGYIDTEGEADKMLVEGLSGTLVTIAKDVKIQVEFNPHHVKGYRLLGYENRMLKKEDFNDDTKDAGEIGAGHTVTALYELIPADSEEEVAAPKVDELKYQKDVEKTDAARSDELLTVKLRHKEPDGEKSKLLSFPVKNEVVEFDAANVDLKFASAVAAFGMLLRDSQYKGTADYDSVLRWAKSSLGEDEFNYREEFLKLIRAAKSLENR